MKELAEPCLPAGRGFCRWAKEPLVLSEEFGWGAPKRRLYEGGEYLIISRQIKSPWTQTRGFLFAYQSRN
ncbi:MAG: hypothetical protein A2214_00690 [Candidatus Harrisonbacteria bacterium RIFOXYA1_FULL_48_8]|uniref:Uncharacterized protein n=1 Tax=Candidatus Harrisonbacteria bacterium RIFOXYA1_FULL_48_8 TaxID=1798411 RepID=A0A1G1ZX08_9BACT|nr:MAG: hypothetical protein A2214_00690 [Candidatus Harrisonbacteria bacterium RIFOXYA1_FULL_48_8]